MIWDLNAMQWLNCGNHDFDCNARTNVVDEYKIVAFLA
jgi:hypothetical protein